MSVLSWGCDLLPSGCTAPLLHGNVCRVFGPQETPENGKKVETESTATRGHMTGNQRAILMKRANRVTTSDVAVVNAATPDLV